MSRFTLAPAPALEAGNMLPVSRAPFRPELQGLRALSVVLVMVYHVWMGRVSGGVDVFLMLSAFFLTGSFIRKAESGRSFDLPGYWLNTFRRLLPAAVAVLLASLVATAALLPSSRWSSIFEQAWASLFYRQNWQLAQDAVDYYAANSATTSPLQHFWSLSIQGQVFLLWPLLLGAGLLVHRLLVRRFPRLRYAMVMAMLFAVVFAASLTYSIRITASDQAWAYFDTGARLWEFALGSMVAIALPFMSRLPGAVRAPLGWIGLAAIVSCGILLPVQQQFPGYLALWPTLAAACVIIAGQSRFGVDRLLALPVLGWLGGIAYALYLWHWPVLVFFVVRSGESKPSLVQGLMIMGLSLVLAWATTRIVESPMRSWKWLSAKRRRVGVVIALMLAVVMVPLNGWEHRVAAQEQLAATQPAVDNPGALVLEPGYVASGDPGALMIPLTSRASFDWSNFGDDCSGAYASDDPLMEYCQEGGNPAAEKTLFLLGDSHMQHWSGAVAQLAEQKDLHWVLLTRPGCRYGDETQDTDADCTDFNAVAAKYVLEHRPDALLTLATRTAQGPDADGNSPGQRERLATGYRAGIKAFLDAGIQVIGMRDTPRFDASIPECVDRFGPDGEPCTMEVDYAMAKTSPVLGLPEMNLPGHRFSTLDLTDLLCPQDSCRPVIGNVLAYMDESHLTSTYVRTTTPVFGQRLYAALGWT
ncbi:acyltransferase family protein [Paeniglutamicibacter cryotolerans]|uniref:Peptidoglycan/LPS O-acetylase OafA/YrhL n=1 Tax=Paeniglutamicibacter cryotolerans TaxID=670079 RepID=A0A839QL27_9MICC|nr:acyltransferase family protein [Paeniglutamicibacter cryotolerans]MBB2993872.1 peptidoglycan/LPS O-acetylase OafA/YrhL [Paeniglutamicibacter cryotolerans]